MKLSKSMWGYAVEVDLPARYEPKRIHIEVTVATDDVHQETPGINVSATGTFSPVGVQELVDALQFAAKLASGDIVIDL